MFNKCIDCAKLNLQDQNRYGEYYCVERGRYYDGDSYACDYGFVMRESEYRTCYLTTAFCEILGYPDDCYELEILRKYRDSYLKSDEEGKELLKEYDEVGPLIANCLYNDKNKLEVVNMMGIDYIYPAIEFINFNRYEDAKDTYVAMVNKLKGIYNIKNIKKDEDKIKRL